MLVKHQSPYGLAGIAWLIAGVFAAAIMIAGPMYLLNRIAQKGVEGDARKKEIWRAIDAWTIRQGTWLFVSSIVSVWIYLMSPGAGTVLSIVLDYLAIVVPIAMAVAAVTLNNPITLEVSASRDADDGGNRIR
ncbi:hypothetical protein UG54_00800 [Gordonia sihwensis]|nr:hypothetical protein UG54_00800 [Gordonia sihwensis]